MTELSYDVREYVDAYDDDMTADLPADIEPDAEADIVDVIEQRISVPLPRLL